MALRSPYSGFASMRRGEDRDEIDAIRLEIGAMLLDWEPAQPPFGGALAFLDKAAKILKSDPDEALRLLKGACGC